MIGVRPFAMVVLLAVAARDATAQTPSSVGAWDAPFSLPLISIHSIVLPTGKVLLFSAEHGVPGIHGWVLDPVTLALTNVPPPSPWDPDCAGHSFLPDGRVMVAGGTLSFTPLTGTARAYLFDPVSQQWTRIADMARGRWYPTCVTLEDGTVLTMAGLSDVPSTDNPDIESWDPAGPSTWQLVGQKSLPYYPLLHLLPSGLVVMVGPSRVTQTYDALTDVWTPIANTAATGRFEGSSVLLPPTLGRVMLVGGYNGSGGQPTNSTEILDFGSAVPQWRPSAHMAFPRMEHNVVLLPDGKVLAIGGRSDNDDSPTPVMTPEIFNPSSETWTPVAPHSAPRRYHSTAVLLPDGRVLSAGGDFQPSGQIYSPAYLFRGARPAIVSAPATIVYGTTFPIEFAGTTSAHDVVLMALPCVTHSNNMCQRYVRLGTVPVMAGTVTVPTPASGTIGPPGFYMLFVVDGNGIPSVSRMVRVTGDSGETNPGRVPLTLTLSKAATPGDLVLDWEETCSMQADGYGIYEGTLGAWYSHTLLDCSDTGSDQTEQVTPASGLGGQSKPAINRQLKTGH
jgi:galactose oxidase